MNTAGQREGNTWLIIVDILCLLVIVRGVVFLFGIWTEMVTGIQAGFTDSPAGGVVVIMSLGVLFFYGMGTVFTAYASFWHQRRKTSWISNCLSILAPAVIMSFVFVSANSLNRGAELTGDMMMRELFMSFCVFIVLALPTVFTMHLVNHYKLTAFSRVLVLTVLVVMMLFPVLILEQVTGTVGYIQLLDAERVPDTFSALCAMSLTANFPGVLFFLGVDRKDLLHLPPVR